MTLLYELHVRAVQEGLAFRMTHGSSPQTEDDAFKFRQSVLGSSRSIAAGDGEASLPVPYDNESWDGVKELLGRPWLFRMWTLQEFVLAKDAAFRCGNKEISLSQMHCAMSTISLHNRNPFRPGKDGTGILQLSGYHDTVEIMMIRHIYVESGKLDLIC